MNSPCNCDQYCTYTVINQAGTHILSVEVVDKIQTQLKSAQLEATNFQMAIGRLTAAGVKVKKVVTNAHPKITSIMSECRFSQIAWLTSTFKGTECTALPQIFYSIQRNTSIVHNLCIIATQECMLQYTEY